MRSAPTACRIPCAKRTRAGFTLAEVLAALAFMSIVIPVAVQGLRIASRAGEVAQRKGTAVRVAERLLNEFVATSQGPEAKQNGLVQDGPYPYRWQMQNETWDKEAMRLVSITVTFPVQGQDQQVRLSTLFDNTQP